MSKTILYINDTYIQSPEQIKEIMSNQNLIQKDDSLRREILSLYRDGVLDKWLDNRGLKLNIIPSSERDDDVFTTLYKKIVDENECPNLNSDFSKFGEFLRCEIGSNSYPINNGEIILETVNTEKVKFVFKSFKVDNNTRKFFLKDNEKLLSSIECDWNDKIKGKEHCFEFPSFNPSKFEGKHLSLIEGEDNRLCKILCNFPDKKDIELNGETLTFYYFASMKCWVGKIINSITYFKGFETYIRKKYSELPFEMLDHNDISKLKKEPKWKKIQISSFWVRGGQYYNPYSDSITIVPLCSKNNERHQCWVKLKKLP